MTIADFRTTVPSHRLRTPMAPRATATPFPPATTPTGMAAPSYPAVVLDGPALSRTRFMISPLNETLAEATRYAGSAAPHPTRLYRHRAAVRTAHADAVLRALSEALRATRWPKAGLLSPARLTGITCPDFDQELGALHGRLLDADADTADVTVLLDALRAAYELWLADDWPGRLRSLEDDLAYRAHLLIRYGAEQVIDSLHEQVSYADQLLYVTPPPTALTGAAEPHYVPQRAAEGLLIVPSWTAQHPALLCGGELPVLRYPARNGFDLRAESERSAPRPQAITALIGRARSHALASIGTGCSTTELADRLGVGAATASSHATALRRAGLIVTVRRGKRVEHLLTDLGSRLLNAGSDNAGGDTGDRPGGPA
ncbi:hypothetical protein [Streptomyces sp. NPDC087300]|uniref:hypothetical protein n=1 Tax=Streptomyces sp. NPDC087300 TaxID=3365780 RepID=UPI0037FCFFBF